MVKRRAERGRGIFYTRDSGGKHEMTPGQYVEWASKRASGLGVAFDASSEAINEMIATGQSQDGDLFLDFDVSGNLLSRPGLDALMAEVARDLSVSHVFIPRPDRLVRPDHPVDGVLLENSFRHAGVHIIYMNRECPPIPLGERQDIGDLITSVVQFEASGKDRRELAEKIICAQIALAKLGFSIGGRAPFGFRRWLIKVDGTPVRQLEDGERVRMHGHHVAWLPGPEEELELTRRILAMLKTKHASTVAYTLTKEGIPSPDADRYRSDNGVRHKVSGCWNVSTINKIARCSLLVAMVQAGTRSMGDQQRFTPDGPRSLDASDFRDHDGKPKVIHNPKHKCVTSKAHFEPIVDVEEHAELMQILDDRAGKQQGVSHSRDPARNPLGGRVFDMNCGWLMYRTPYQDTFHYKCGYYQQSHGQKCDHNWSDGPMSVVFVLAIMRQQLLQPHLWQRFEQRIRELGKSSKRPDASEAIDRERQKLHTIQDQLSTAERNLAFAKSAEQYEAVSKVFDELKLDESRAMAEIQRLEQQANVAMSPENAIERALATARLLPGLVDIGNDDFLAARDAYEAVNAKLFLRFRKVPQGKRSLNKIAGGYVTLGDTPPPIKLYDGPTSREKLKNPAKKSSAGSSSPLDPNPTTPATSSEEGESLGNRSRGDCHRADDRRCASNCIGNEKRISEDQHHPHGHDRQQVVILGTSYQEPVAK